MSGFYFVPHVYSGTHQALPLKDTWIAESTQQPASLLAEGDYPVIAVCQRCHGRIRLAVKNQMEWVHVPSEETEVQEK